MKYIFSSLYLLLFTQLVFAQSEETKKGKAVHLLEIGMLVGESADISGFQAEETSSSLSAKYFLGWHLSNHFILGANAGIDSYSGFQTLIPVGLGIRGDIFGSETKLYYGFDFGHAFPQDKESDSFQYDGGFFFQPMLGIKRTLNEDTGIFMQIGYKNQKAFSKQENFNWLSERDHRLKRVSVSLGFVF